MHRLGVDVPVRWTFDRISVERWKVSSNALHSLWYDVNTRVLAVELARGTIVHDTGVSLRSSCANERHVDHEFFGSGSTTKAEVSAGGGD